MFIANANRLRGVDHVLDVVLRHFFFEIGTIPISF